MAQKPSTQTAQASASNGPRRGANRFRPHSLVWAVGLLTAVLLLAVQPVKAHAQFHAEQANNPSTAVPTAPDGKPWNFLLFIADDTSAHDLGCYGSPDVKTPHIDKLSDAALTFDLAFNTAPMCAPTRMALYSGLFPVHSGAHPNHSAVYPDVQSMPHYLRPLGYQVALMGKRHYRPAENFPFDHIGGRDHDGGQGVDLDFNIARQFMNQNADAPWCLVVASNQAHTPWTRGNPKVYDPDTFKLPPYLLDTPQTREGLTKYFAEITYMDNQVGQVLKHLEESGQAEHTVVVYLSEQGSNLPFAKWTCYDAGLKSACLIKVPGVTGKGRTDAIMQYIDILPTFIEMAGGDALAKNLDGRSLLPVLKGETDHHRDAAYGTQTSRGIYSGPKAYGIRSIRTDKHLLVWNLNFDGKFQNTVTQNGSPQKIYKDWEDRAKAGEADAIEATTRYQHRPEYELYDVQQDPWNMHNIIDAPELQSTIESMKHDLEAWMQAQGDEGKATEMDALNRMPGRH